MIEDPENLEHETIVVTTADGVVMTGSRVEAFEGRVLKAIRRPLYLALGVLALIFVIVIGLSVVMSDFSNKVDHINTIATDLTSPEAKAQQQLAIKNLLDGMDCKDQLNLQRLVNRLSDKGFTPLVGITVVEPACQPHN